MIKKYEHNSFYNEKKDSDTIIIFIHGILESPNQFRPFAKLALRKGYSISAILLDGHGKSGENFANSSLKKWVKCVDEEILKWKEKYKNIILVGHSMGATLSILSYLEHRESIKAIVSISTPMHVRVKLNIAISSLKIALGKIDEKDMLTNHAYNAFSVERCSFLTYLRWLPRYIDLFNLIIRSRNSLKKVEVPMLVIHTMKDELVSHRSLKVFEKKLNSQNKIICLQNSGHFYYDEKDLDYLCNEFESFLDK
ncbi:alpha/beta fold hydrolase [Clostridium sp. CCUG 7971]|uniref:alpha/beta hydrolase n=1 Tax=Clostridium sp. CCUG 7971 TaxID=2811414 RepID=UPI001ABAFAC1|nr:alpha/beta fold hydrolase [Clostridium sp. CCUG 7971]MBO3443677.1 alpha/beta fold hydrolase [Clostridium sp. CCUG 7971]